MQQFWTKNAADKYIPETVLVPNSFYYVLWNILKFYDS